MQRRLTIVEPDVDDKIGWWKGHQTEGALPMVNISLASFIIIKS